MLRSLGIEMSGDFTKITQQLKTEIIQIPGDRLGYFYYSS